jgi:hypothetical protein
VKIIDEPQMETAEGLGVVIMCPDCNLICLTAFTGPGDDHEPPGWTDEDEIPLQDQTQATCWNCHEVTVKLPTPEQVDDFIRSIAR